MTLSSDLKLNLFSLSLYWQFAPGVGAAFFVSGISEAFGWPTCILICVQAICSIVAGQKLSHVRVSLLVSDLDEPSGNSCSLALDSERSEVLSCFSILSCSESSPDPSRSLSWWWSGWIVVFPLPRNSWLGFRSLPRTPHFAFHRHIPYVRSSVSFRSIRHQRNLYSLRH